MPNEGTERLIKLLEKALMIQLHSMKVAQGDIAKMLNKSKTDVNKLLKPVAKGKGSMVLNVSDSASHRRDQIDTLADLLENAPKRQALAKAVNFGKKRVKSVGELAAKLSSQFKKTITAKRVTEIGKPLVNLAFTQERIVENERKTTAYAKLDQERVREALKLANNKKKREAYYTKSRPKIKVVGHTVTIKAPFRPKVKTLYIDDVKEFQRVKSIKKIPPSMSPPRLSEA